MYIYIYTHTHTHIHTYIYTYIYKELKILSSDILSPCYKSQICRAACGILFLLTKLARDLYAFNCTKALTSADKKLFLGSSTTYSTELFSKNSFNFKVCILSAVVISLLAPVL
jgi:hypothetical protein